jgi:ABC-type glycerol-3-phosphate transport system permease component
MLMAVGMLMVAPMALVFLLAQRFMVRGVVISGLKG